SALPKRCVAKQVYVPVIFHAKFPREVFEHLKLRAFFPKTSKIAIKHKRRANLLRQRSFQISDPTASIHRLHVTPCGSPNEFRLSRRKLCDVFLCPRNVRATDDSPVTPNAASRLRLIRLRRVPTHVSHDSKL